MLRFFKVSFKHILWLMSTLVLFVIAINLWVLSYSPIDEVGRVLPREYALLLGTSKFTRSGMVNPYYRYRIVAASELYLSGKVKKIIASGDNSTRYYNEPAVMRTDLIQMGVPTDDIILDFAGFRTLDSVARCKNKFGVADPIIITQKYHSYRALFLARNMGLDRAIAYTAKSPEDTSYTMRNHRREILARINAVFDVYILDSRPKFEQ
jgi:SanA protein